MEVTTLSYDNLNKHGKLFVNMFRARHRELIQQNSASLGYERFLSTSSARDTDQSVWLMCSRGIFRHHSERVATKIVGQIKALLW